MTQFLFNSETPLWRYSLQVALLAILPAMAILEIVRFVMVLAGLNLSRFDAPPTSVSVGGVFGTIVFAPVIETFILALLITVLSSFMSNKLKIAVVCGIIWGLCHAIFGLLWFFGPAWGFFILSCAFLAWREKSFKQAYIAAFIPHVLNNAIMVSVMLLSKHA